MSDQENKTPPPDPVSDPEAIEFHPSEPLPLPPAQPSVGQSQEAAAAPGAQDNKFEIKWFDEEREPQEGKLFAEPAPELPRQPFEVLDWEEPAKKRKNKDESKPSSEPAPFSAARAGRFEPPVRVRPSLWVRLFWGLMPILLFVGGYASVLLTQEGIGYSWDEAYYYEPSMKAADWLVEALRGNHPYSAEAIDKFWDERHEHPSIPKFMEGLALRMFKDPQEHLYAMRLPSAILWGLILSMLYLIGRRASGPAAGLVAALLLATMPRLFGHAHFASLEVPLLFMMVLVVFCFLRGLDSALWAPLTGVAFGLLLATKINAFFLPVPLILWGHLYARHRYINNLFCMLVISPVVMVAAWPWLWHDTAMRFLEYLAFHSQHQQTALFFEGRIWGYGDVNAPWYYPLVMLRVTLPLSALLLVAWGTLRTALRPHRRPYGALFLLIVLVLLGVACAPSTPRYDGVRLFLPVFPFLALLGGLGFSSLLAKVEWILKQRMPHQPVRVARVLNIVSTALMLLIVLEGGVACYRFYPYLLSYFSPTVGGLRGAQDRGFEVTYWGESLNQDVIDVINTLPEGSSIKPLALHELCLNHLQRWGKIEPYIRIGGNPPYDYHLLQMRLGFHRRFEQMLTEPGRFKVVHKWGKWGVPLIALYDTRSLSQPEATPAAPAQP